MRRQRLSITQSQAAREYISLINGLHSRWTPHDDQVRVLTPLFAHGAKDIFAQCGRNWGKTESICYALWRWAKSNPFSENYYFAPYMKQAREILWASQRMQQFGPVSWLDGNPNNTEMRIRFTNGSFIKLDGSDNVEAYRGVKPKGLSVFDEFKDFRPEFYEAYDPNRAAYNSPLVIIGTPPERDCQFIQLANEYRLAKGKYYFEAPSDRNPHISREWLAKKKAELYARGEGDVWEREYMARFVPGGASKIFPMLTRDVVVPRGTLMKTIERDMRKLNWFWINDPAAASVFAAIFVAVNPYTKMIYIVDEIYETNQLNMTVDQIGRRGIKMRDDISTRVEWRQIYDEAETWFSNEMLDRFQESFEPTFKHAMDKAHGLSLFKDALLQKRVMISDSCPKTYWELDNYFKDKNGKIPKENDHTIDCIRYFLAASHYELNTRIEVKETDNENFRAARISHDFPELDDFGSRVSDNDDVMELWKR